MTQAATLSIVLALPRTAGEFPQAPWPPTPGLSVAFEQDVSHGRIVLTAPGTTALTDFALLPATGCQILLVTLDTLDDAKLALTAPVRFDMTGTTSGTIWLPIGGGQFAIVAPGTTQGVTGMSITVTAPCVTRVQAVG